MTEDELQRQVVELAHATGWRAMHVRRSIGYRDGERAWQTTTSINGWPDLFLWQPKRGLVRVAELKGDGGQVTPEQAQVLDELERCGLDTGVWWPKDWDDVERTLVERRTR